MGVKLLHKPSGEIQT